MGLREDVDGRLGEGTYDRMLSEQIEEHKWDFQIDVDWDGAGYIVGELADRLARSATDVQSVAYEVINEVYDCPDGHLDHACRETAAALLEDLEDKGFERAAGADALAAAAFDIRESELIYGEGFYDVADIYEQVADKAKLTVDLCAGNYGYADDPTGRFCELLWEGKGGEALSWARDPDNRDEMERNPVTWLLATQGYTVDDLCDPERHTPFLDTLREEIMNSTYPEACVVTFLARVDIRDMDAYLREGVPLAVSESACCGLYDAVGGSGGPLDVRLERPVTLDPAGNGMVLLEDCGRSTGGFWNVDECYRLVPEAWDAAVVGPLRGTDRRPDRAAIAEPVSAAAAYEGAVLGYDERIREEVGRDASHRYRLLSRMQSDCEYVLGNRGLERDLWAGGWDLQCRYMRALYNSFDEDGRPEWISMEDIDGYAARAKAARLIPDAVRASACAVAESLGSQDAIDDKISLNGPKVR